MYNYLVWKWTEIFCWIRRSWLSTFTAGGCPSRGSEAGGGGLQKRGGTLKLRRRKSVYHQVYFVWYTWTLTLYPTNRVGQVRLFSFRSFIAFQSFNVVRFLTELSFSKIIRSVKNDIFFKNGFEKIVHSVTNYHLLLSLFQKIVV